jgi:hypothetical protein
MKFKDLDGVKTLRDFPEEGIKKGEIGTIVYEFTIPDEAYEVEFCDEYGRTRAMFAILPEDLELIYSHTYGYIPNTDLPHASGN